jgi:hypothetical protein
MATALLIAVQVSESASTAHALCDPGRGSQWGNWLAGWTKQPGQPVYSVRSDVEQYDPFVDNNSYGYKWSAAWVMLEAPGDHWSQIGWRKLKNWGEPMVRQHFIQATTGNPSSPYYEWSEQNYESIGTWTQYKVEYVVDPIYGFDYFTFFINGTYKPGTDASFVPNTATIAGEINNLSHQMPGGVNNHTSMPFGFYTIAAGQRYFYGTPFWNPSDYVSEFGVQVISGWQADIWDRRCTN